MEVPNDYGDNQHEIHAVKSLNDDDTGDDDECSLKQTLKVYGRLLNSRLMELNRQSLRRSEFTFPIKVEREGE